MVKKAVEAASAVIRSEFTKLLKELSGSFRQVDDSLNDCVSRGFVATNLEERITALKPPYNISMISLVLAIIVERLRQSVRSLVRLKCGQMTMNSILEGTMSELEAWLSIRTITANKLWSNSVVRIEKLRVQGIDSAAADIDVAHPVLRQQSDSASADVGVQKVPTVLVRFCRRDHWDLVIRQRRRLKGTGLVVIKDLTSLNIQTFNRARNSPLVDKTWSWNGKIYALLKSGKKVLSKPFLLIENYCEEV